jgi:hypothetical protein
MACCVRIGRGAVVALLFSCVAGCGAPARDARPADAELEHRRHQALQALEQCLPHSAATAFAKLFENAGAPGLQKLIDDWDVSIALHAGWETICRTSAFDPDDPIMTIPVDRAARFVDFFQRRTGHHPPQWWIDGVVDLRAREGDFDPGGRYAPTMRETFVLDETSNRFLTAASGTAISQDKDHVVFRRDGRSIRMWRCVLQQEIDLAILHECQVQMTETHGVVLLFDRASGYAGYPPVLFGIDRRYDRILWRAPAWFEIIHGKLQEIRKIGVELFVPTIAGGDPRVILYGLGPCSRFAECFNANNGRALWRFSSHRWNVQRPD